MGHIIFSQCLANEVVVTDRIKVGHHELHLSATPKEKRQTKTMARSIGKPRTNHRKTIGKPWFSSFSLEKRIYNPELTMNTRSLTMNNRNLSIKTHMDFTMTSPIFIVDHSGFQSDEEMNPRSYVYLNRNSDRQIIDLYEFLATEAPSACLVTWDHRISTWNNRVPVSTNQLQWSSFQWGRQIVPISTSWISLVVHPWFTVHFPVILATRSWSHRLKAPRFVPLSSPGCCRNDAGKHVTPGETGHLWIISCGTSLLYGWWILYGQALYIYIYVEWCFQSM